jgi:hypothetical protein
MAVNAGAALTLQFLTITRAHSQSGAIHNAGTLSVTHCIFSANGGFFSQSAEQRGGALTNDAMATVSNSTFSNNGAIGRGGGAITNNGTLSVSNSNFSNNAVAEPMTNGGDRGAILNQGTLSITQSSFNGNNGRLFGGAICNTHTLLVSSSTFSGNVAEFSGGAIDDSGATMVVSNSTFSGNSVSTNPNDNGQGGAILNEGTTAALITNSTFSRNLAADGGAVFGPAKIKGSILTASTGGNCGTPPTDVGYNISDDTSCGFIPRKGSANNPDPRLLPDWPTTAVRH